MTSYFFRLATLALALVGMLTADDKSKQGKQATITQAQAESILNELRQIRQLLEKQPPTAALTLVAKSKLKTNDRFSLGSKAAPLTIIEFADYECSFCRQFQATTFEEIKKKYIDTGKLRFISRTLPLNIHPNGIQAAHAVLCAGDQGQFWEMHSVLYSDVNKLTQTDIRSYAQVLNLDVTTFQNCLNSGRHNIEIANDLRDASLLQINGTPSFLVGKTTSEGVEGYMIMGAFPFSVFDAKLKEIEMEK